jgi:hypothetical protein
MTTWYAVDSWGSLTVIHYLLPQFAPLRCATFV